MFNNCYTFCTKIKWNVLNIKSDLILVHNVQTTECSADEAYKTI